MKIRDESNIMCVCLIGNIEPEFLLYYTPKHKLDQENSRLIVTPFVK